MSLYLIAEKLLVPTSGSLTVLTVVNRVKTLLVRKILRQLCAAVGTASHQTGLDVWRPYCAAVGTASH